jgi:hypothetical protein
MLWSRTGGTIQLKAFFAECSSECKLSFSMKSTTRSFTVPSCLYPQQVHEGSKSFKANILYNESKHKNIPIMNLNTRIFLPIPTKATTRPTNNLPS